MFQPSSKKVNAKKRPDATGRFVNGLIHWKLLFLLHRFAFQEQTLDMALTQRFRFESEERTALGLLIKLLTQLLNSNNCWTGLLNTSSCLTAGVPSGRSKTPVC